MSSKKRTNKSVYAPMETILVASGNQALSTGAVTTALLVGTGTALNILDGQLGVMSADHTGVVGYGAMILTGSPQTALQTKAIKLVQGTPKSAAIQTVDPFGAGHKAVVQTAPIYADKINSVSTLPYRLPTNHVVALSGFSTPTVSTRYSAYLELNSVRGDRDFGQNRDSINASVETPAVAPTDITDFVLQNLAINLNTQSNLVTGNRSFVVLGIDMDGSGTGTRLGTLTAASAAVPFMTWNGSTYSLAMNQQMIATLQSVYAADNNYDNAEIVNLNLAAPGASAHVDRLLFIGLDEPIALAFDNIEQTKVRVTPSVSTNLTYTTTTLSAPQEGANDGRKWQLRYDDRAGLQIFNQQIQPYCEYFIVPPDYIVAGTNYTATIIEYFDEDATLTTDNVYPKIAVILLPAAVSNPTARVNQSYSVATTASTTVTELNTVLTAWLASASVQFSQIEFLGSATSSAVFV